MPVSAKILVITNKCILNKTLDYVNKIKNKTLENTSANSSGSFLSSISSICVCVIDKIYLKQ